MHSDRRVFTSIFILAAGALLIYMLCLWAPASHVLREKTTFVMGTVVSEKIYGGTEQTLNDVEDIIRELDGRQLSWREKESLLAQLNTKKTMQLEEPFGSYIRDVFSLAEATGGALDPTLRPLIELWGIEGSHPHVPSGEALCACMEQIGYEKAVLTDTEIILPDTMSLDFGAVGKGIALDAVESYLTKEGISGAAVSVGGSILTHGVKPEGVWNIAIRHPAGEDQTAMGVLHITGTKFISTSGDYEKYFEEAGVLYHHILDRVTGFPSDSGLSSVTVVCNQGLISDGLSTACFVLGYEKSIPVLEQYHGEAVFVFKDSTVAVTKGLKDCFELLDTGFKINSGLLCD